MADSTNKVVTTENLGTFKTQMESVIDEKVAAAGGTVTYATEADILALFADSSSDSDSTDSSSETTT